MKTPFLIPLCLTAWLGGALAVRAQGTAFTYQGRLTEANAPVSGLYDFIFLVYDSPNGSVPLVSGYPVYATPLSNGLFTATVDFGPGVFTGANRWLGINLRTNGTGSFTELLPRHVFTASPYAVTAGNLAAGGLAAGVYSNPITFNNPADSFTGNGGGLTNINAAALGGLGAGSFWQTGGNAGTSSGVNFVGTSDNQPLELRVNNQRALRLEPTGPGNAPNVIGGSAGNSVAAGVSAATIGGGTINSILDGADYATLAGGSGNQIAGSQGTVGGGNVNLAGALLATVSGGRGNWATGSMSTIAGGSLNLVGSRGAVIGGGQSNNVAGELGTIGGGGQNTIETNALRGTVSGGLLNRILSSAMDATVGGGSNNLALGPGATVGGGVLNRASQNATIAGGVFNYAEGSGVVSGGSSNNCWGGYNVIGGGLGNGTDYAMAGSTIAGGEFNVISWRGGNLDGFYGSIGGGIGNLVIGEAATVPGGSSNAAWGPFSFAAGKSAAALHAGAFVWADSQDGTFSSTTSNQFALRSANGVVIQSATNGTALELRTGGALKVTGAGVGTGTPVFIHQAVAANISGNYTTIDHPLCNGDPYAILTVTPNFNPGGGGGTYNNHPIGVWYNGARWAIFNQDLVSMPVNAAFNVLVVKP